MRTRIIGRTAVGATGNPLQRESKKDRPNSRSCEPVRTGSAGEMTRGPAYFSGSSNTVALSAGTFKADTGASTC
jgi:hypothetical protein